MSDFRSGGLSYSICDQTSVAGVGCLLDTKNHGRLISGELPDELIPPKQSEIALFIRSDKCWRQGQALGLCGAHSRVGLLLESSSLSVWGQIANMTVLDPVGC
jgi:hypothetical protein